MTQRNVPGGTTTSASHLRIGEASLPGTGGVIGMTLCPGKKGPSTGSGLHWGRDLDADLERIRRWGAEAVVTLMERKELDWLQVGHMGEAVAAGGMRWFHLPIVDTRAPDESFEVRWKESGPQLRAILADGGRVLLHCRGGLGRTGVVAARLLMEFGVALEDAVRIVREARRHTIETSVQERYLRDLARAPGGVAAALVPFLAEPWPLAPSRVNSAHFAGCLLGGAVGDALGAPGNTCLSALRSGKMGTVAESINSSKGCGGVMRVAPVGLFIHSERDSGDSDSTGAITGNILGALLGRDAIPTHWLDSLELREVIEGMAERLYLEETGHTRHTADFKIG